MKKKLIEVSLPLEEINKASAKEKSIRHGHPSTMHLWWARRPLAACRAVLFASLVDDPSSLPRPFPHRERSGAGAPMFARHYQRTGQVGQLEQSDGAGSSAARDSYIHRQQPAARARSVLWRRFDSARSAATGPRKSPKTPAAEPEDHTSAAPLGPLPFVRVQYNRRPASRWPAEGRP